MPCNLRLLPKGSTHDGSDQQEDRGDGLSRVSGKSEHIERIYEHAGSPILDYALVNSAPVSAIIRERYAAEGAEPTQADI